MATENRIPLPEPTRRALTVLWFGALAGVTGALLIPNLIIPGEWTDKVLHAGAFLILGTLAVPTACSLRSAVPSIVTLLVVAAATELLQSAFIQGRTGSIGDFAADGIGIATGIALGLWLASRPALVRAIMSFGRR